MAKHIHPDQDLGQPLPHDPDFRGPLQRRSCTDVICLLIFLITIAAWVALGWYALANGDPNALLVPKDSFGRRCGVDSNVRDKPYLFFFDLTKCLEPTVPFTGCNTPQVCVRNCPSKFYYSQNPQGEQPDAEFCSDYNACPAWYLPSQSFQYRCIPSPSALNNKTMLDLIPGQLFEELPKAISNIKLLSETEEIGQNVVEDLMRSWQSILIGIALAVVVCIIYILILRWVASVMVWLSIAGVVVGLAGAVYVSATNYDKWRKEQPLEEDAKSVATKKDLWLAGLIISSGVLAIILLVLIFLRKRIVLAIALIKEASRAVSSVTAVLFFPIFPWVFQVGVIAYAIVIGLYLATTGSPIYKARFVTEACTGATDGALKNGTICNPDEFYQYLNKSSCSDAVCKLISMNEDSFYPYLQVFNVFEFFWVVFFVSALGQMILAMVFAQWYWTMKKSSLPFFAITSATCRVIRYHLGTVAFGSLLVAICRMIRVALEYLDKKLKKYDNQLVRAILCCLKCFFWCLEKFIKFINKNAYIMCAIHGKNFCTSAKDAFMLLARNILRVFVLDKVTDFLFFLSKLLVTVGVGAVSYVWFATDLIKDNSGLNYAVVPVVVIMVVTYLIASIFFSVYAMAVDTLFLCFLEDSERNDGTAQKPYFMTKNLMKILGKKNKFH